MSKTSFQFKGSKLDKLLEGVFQSQKRPHINGTKVRRISGDSLAKILIPIPCPSNPKRSLEIQGEIVRILDSFTELTAELIVATYC